jgi:hypothetical protein
MAPARRGRILLAVIARRLRHRARHQHPVRRRAHLPPTDPAGVGILRRQPMMPHVRLGEIEVDASTDPAPPVSEVEEKLRVAGAKLGANAAVVVHDRLKRKGAYVTGPWRGRTVEPSAGRKVIGVAIRYR